MRSRFLLCAHIVCCFEDPHGLLFKTIKRERLQPYWRDPLLALTPTAARNFNNIARRIAIDAPIEADAIRSEIDIPVEDDIRNEIGALAEELLIFTMPLSIEFLMLQLACL